MDGKLAALDLLKEWSNMLLLVQISAIGFLGTVLPKATSKGAKKSAALCIGFFFVSILAATNLMGSLPIIAQKIEGVSNIYTEPGNWQTTVRFSANVEIIFFILGLSAFAVFAMTGAFVKNESS